MEPHKITTGKMNDDRFMGGVFSLVILTDKIIHHLQLVSPTVGSGFSHSSCP